MLGASARDRAFSLRDCSWRHGHEAVGHGSARERIHDL